MITTDDTNELKLASEQFNIIIATVVIITRATKLIITIDDINVWYSRPSRTAKEGMYAFNIVRVQTKQAMILPVAFQHLRG